MVDSSNPGRVLLVEDDEKLSGLIANFLSQHGFEVHEVHRGDLACQAFGEFRPSLVVLDLMLPGQDGLQVCRQIRALSDTPIVILTAREDDLDHILGLESGADDYVIKPIKPPVLLARLRALQRRHVAPFSAGAALVFGELRIDPVSREVTLEGRPIEFTTMEFNLLQLLAENAGVILSRDDILNKMRGIEFDGMNRSVDVYISKLRNKLDDAPREPMRIKTVWGKGYLFNPFAWER